jgi:hypothetical protein
MVKIDPNIAPVIGQYADYLDTGIWRVKDGKLIPPEDLTERQLKDFMMVFGELVNGGEN